LAQLLSDEGMYMRSEHTANIQVWAKAAVLVQFGPVSPPHVTEARLCWCVLPANGFSAPTEVAFVLLQTLVDIKPTSIVREVSDALTGLHNWIGTSTMARKGLPSFVAASVPLPNMCAGMIAFGQAASTGIDFANTRSPEGQLGITATNVPGVGVNTPRLMLASHRGRFPATYSVSAGHNNIAIHLHFLDQ
jgi:hypothetical protein